MITAHDTRLLSAVRRALNAALADQADGIVKGAPGDYAKYREFVGVVRGLRMALETLDEVVSRDGSQDKDE